jgi:hypothetical protein
MFRSLKFSALSNKTITFDLITYRIFVILNSWNWTIKWEIIKLRYCYIVWAHKSSLTLPLFIEVPVPSQESKQSHICLLGVLIFASFCHSDIAFWNCYDNIVILLFLILSSSTVDRGLEPWSDQAKVYKIGICCFSAKHAALRRKSKDWLARNQNNVSECPRTVVSLWNQSQRFVGIVPTVS